MDEYRELSNGSRTVLSFSKIRAYGLTIYFAKLEYREEKLVEVMVEFTAE